MVLKWTHHMVGSPAYLQDLEILLLTGLRLTMNVSKTRLTMGCLWEKWKTGKWSDVNYLGRNKNRKTEGEVHRRRQLHVNALLLITLIYPCGERGKYRGSLYCVCMCDGGAKPCDTQACTTAAPATRASMYDTVWLPENIKPHLVAWEAKYSSGTIDLRWTTGCVSECSNWRSCLPDSPRCSGKLLEKLKGLEVYWDTHLSVSISISLPSSSPPNSEQLEIRRYMGPSKHSLSV